MTRANPRFYNDKKTTGQDQKGNPNGHVIRWAEGGGYADALSFDWDVYLFGARATASPDNVNLSGLTDANDFSSPDGAWFSYAKPGTAVAADRRWRLYRRHQLHDARGAAGQAQATARPGPSPMSMAPPPRP